MSCTAASQLELDSVQLNCTSNGPNSIRLGIDPIYLGVLIGMNLQTSFLTPPFGFSLFYLRGVANKILKTVEIYKGVLPFVALQILGIIIVFNFPLIATWLPDILFGNNFEISSSNLIEDINNKNDEDIGILDNFKNLFNTNYDRSASPLDKFKNIFD